MYCCFSSQNSIIIVCRWVVLIWVYVLANDANGQSSITQRRFLNDIQRIEKSANSADYATAITIAKNGMAWATQLKEDSIYAVFCLHLCTGYMDLPQFDSAIYYLRFLDSVSLVSGLIKINIKAKFYLIDVLHLHLRDFNQAQQILLKADSLVGILNDPAYSAGLEDRKAGQCKNLYEYECAMKHYLQEMKYLDQINDIEKKACALHNMGSLMAELSKYSEAINYYREASILFTKYNYKHYCATTYANMANNFAEMNLIDSSLYYYDLSIQVAREFQNKTAQLYTEVTRAGLLLQQIKPINDSTIALNEKNLINVLKDAQDIGLTEVEASADLILGTYANRRKDFVSAHKYLKEALNLSKKIERNYRMNFNIMKELAELYHQMGNQQDMYTSLINALAYKDSIYQEKQIESASELEARYQNKVKQGEIEKLSAEHEINRLARKNERQFYIGVLGLAVLLIICGWWITYYRNKQKVQQHEKEIQDLQYQMLATRQIALRAQINPHFIFNCMAAIDNYILNNEPTLASELLISFANLIRTILEQSEKDLIPLSQELKSLELYLQLEQIRFNNSFQYSIHFNENLDLEIPPMLLQPYVENAIIHGVNHLEEGDGIISIQVESTALNETTIIIRDNGIGINHSANINMRNRSAHQSMGIRITQERINLLRLTNGIDVKVAIRDLQTENQMGTEVSIIMKTLS